MCGTVSFAINFNALLIKFWNNWNNNKRCVFITGSVDTSITAFVVVGIRTRWNATRCGAWCSAAVSRGWPSTAWTSPKCNDHSARLHYALLSCKLHSEHWDQIQSYVTWTPQQCDQTKWHVHVRVSEHSGSTYPDSAYFWSSAVFVEWSFTRTTGTVTHFQDASTHVIRSNSYSN